MAGEKLASVRPGIDIEVTREAVGVVDVITPWNFPIAIPARKIGRMAKPDEIATVIASVASSRAPYLTGSTFLADGRSQVSSGGSGPVSSERAGRSAFHQGQITNTFATSPRCAAIRSRWSIERQSGKS
jgi:hypothetical protein